LIQIAEIDADPLKLRCPKFDCNLVLSLSEQIEHKKRLECECGYTFCGFCKESWH